MTVWQKQMTDHDELFNVRTQTEGFCISGSSCSQPGHKPDACVWAQNFIRTHTIMCLFCFLYYINFFLFEVYCDILGKVHYRISHNSKLMSLRLKSKCNNTKMAFAKVQRQRLFCNFYRIQNSICSPSYWNLYNLIATLDFKTESKEGEGSDVTSSTWMWERQQQDVALRVAHGFYSIVFSFRIEV